MQLWHVLPPHPSFNPLGGVGVLEVTDTDMIQCDSRALRKQVAVGCLCLGDRDTLISEYVPPVVKTDKNQNARFCTRTGKGGDWGQRQSSLI